MFRAAGQKSWRMGGVLLGSGVSKALAHRRSAWDACTKIDQALRQNDAIAHLPSILGFARSIVMSGQDGALELRFVIEIVRNRMVVSNTLISML